MPIITHKGHDFEVCEEAIEALAGLGEAVAAGIMSGDDAVEFILKQEGYTKEAIEQENHLVNPIATTNPLPPRVKVSDDIRAEIRTMFEDAAKASRTLNEYDLAGVFDQIRDILTRIFIETLQFQPVGFTSLPSPVQEALYATIRETFGREHPCTDCGKAMNMVEQTYWAMVQDTENYVSIHEATANVADWRKVLRGIWRNLD